MSKVTFDYSKATSFISNEEVESMKKIAEDAKKVLVDKTKNKFYYLASEFILY